MPQRLDKCLAIVMGIFYKQMNKEGAIALAQEIRRSIDDIIGSSSRYFFEN